MKDFKVRFTKVSEEVKDLLTEGKTYMVTDGILTFNNGNKSSRFKDFEDLKRHFVSGPELVTEPQQFTKDMLKTGMWVETKNGHKLIVLLGTEHGDIFVNSNSDWLSIENYSQELRHKFSSEKWDISKVYTTQNPPKSLVCSDVILWQRPEPRKIKKSEAEKLLSEHLEELIQIEG